MGTVTANDPDESIPIEAIHNQFHSGAQRNEAEGAENALQNLGIDPIVTTSQNFDVADDLDPDGDSDDVGTEYVYEDPVDSNSQLITSLFSGSGEDEVVLAVSMLLRGCNKTFRNAWWVDDAIGIGFLNDDWAPIGIPEVSASTEHTARFTEDDVSSDALAGTVDIVNQGSGGVTCSDIPKATISLTGEFRLRDGGEPTTLWGSYSQTFSGSPSAVLESIEGGVGGISVGLSPSASTAWSIAHPSDPETIL